jgi:hypothetical protein
MPLEVRQLVVRSSVIQGDGGEASDPAAHQEREEALRHHMAEELRRALRSARDDRKER